MAAFSFGRSSTMDRQLCALLAGLGSLSISLSGCGGGDGASAMHTPAPAPPLNRSEADGRYVGTVTIDGIDYFGDALIAPNGETHLYIGGPYDDGGNIQLTTDAGSIDFVAPFNTPSGNSVLGGVIGRNGEDCGAPGSPSARWCGRGSTARMILESVDSESGAIHGEITDHDETWTFDLTPWSNYYDMPARLDALGGQYMDEVTPFAHPGTVFTIDADGRAFFQSPAYFCTGNGTFTPLGDGETNIFAVEMSIANCDYPYSQYNRDYHGLATLSPSDYWAYDTNVRVWLASSSPDWTAVTMWGRRIPD